MRKYLAGQALTTISGLTLNSENYKEELDILIDRYRNPQVLISAHMETLVKTNKVKNMENYTGYAASCLDSERYESKTHKCVYCSENHSPSQCKK